MKPIRLALISVALLSAARAQDTLPPVVASIGYVAPTETVAPGQVVTVFVPGNIQGDITAAVHQITDHPAPVLGIRPETDCTLVPTLPCSATTAVTIQVPFDIQPSCFVCAISVNFYAQLIISVNGVPGTPFGLTPLADRVHILTACDVVVGGGGLASYNGLPCQPLITHADGSSVTALSPAHAGEEVVAWTVGMGATTPAIPTGQAATSPAPVNQPFYLDFNFRPNALATKPMPVVTIAVDPPVLGQPLFAGLTTGYVGLYQVNFIVPPLPAGVTACNGTVQTNLTVSIGGQYSFDGAGICVTP